MSLSVAAEHHPARALVAPLARILGLYIVLASYGLAYAYVYTNEISPLLQYIQGRIFVVDFTRIDDYVFVALVTPLALLPTGERIVAAGQYLVAVLAIIIFIPVPLIFVSQVDRQTFYSVYVLLWLGIFIVAVASRFSFNLRVTQLSEKQFSVLYYTILILSFLGLLYAARGGLTFVDLDKASQERPGNLNLNFVQSYTTTWFIGSFGGFLVTFAIILRRYIILPLVLGGFVLAYGITVLKFALLAPAWITYAFVMSRFFKASMTRYCLAVAMPFFALSGMWIIIRPDHSSVLYAAFLIANLRLYVIPAGAFNVYYDYFHSLAHPVTYLSHVTLFQFFLRYPYGEGIAVVMRDQYHMGTYNASFLMGDGLAGFGVSGILVICILFSLVLLAINTCFTGLKPFILAISLAIPSFWLINVPLFTTLLSSGLGFLSVVMLFVPRQASWNR